MNTHFVEAFVASTLKVFQTMAFTELQPGPAYFRSKHDIARGDVTGIVGLTGQMNGSLAVSFSGPAILQVISNMFGEAAKEINEEVCDAVGELSNMISGDARRALEQHGYRFEAAIPTVIDGKNHKISHAFSGPYLVLPFTINAENQCFVELCFEEAWDIAALA